ncbi:MAG: hypothetical protein P4L64_13340 [Caulobacteraceae bacterium]|nr:hypothetical protein [Caulobacteraceae bacterium]
MKRVVTGLCLAVGVALLAGCAYDEGRHSHGGGGMSVGYGGYYDDFYGPFHDGYWGGDGYFYYRDRDDHPWRRDDARHFRHEGGQGFHPVQGHTRGPPPGDHGPGPGHDHDGPR